MAQNPPFRDLASALAALFLSLEHKFMHHGYGTKKVLIIITLANL